MHRRLTNRRLSLLVVGSIVLLVGSASDLLTFVEAQDSVGSAEHGHEDEHEQMALIDPITPTEAIHGNEMDGSGMMTEHADDEDRHHPNEMDEEDHHTDVEDGHHSNELNEEDHHTDDDDDHSDVDNDDEAHHAPHSSDEDYAHASDDEEHHDEISLESAIQAATTLTGSFIKSVVPTHSSDDHGDADLVDSHEDESHDDDHHSDHSEEDGEVHLSDDSAAHPSHDEDGHHPSEMGEEDHHTDNENDHEGNGGPSHNIPEIHEDHADEHHAVGEDDHDGDAPTAENVVNATSEEASIAQMVHIHDADVYTQSGYDTETGSDPICWIAPNHLKSDSVSQMTVQSEAFDDHGGHDHMRRWMRRRVSTKAVIDRDGSNRSSVRGTKYIIDTIGNIKVVPIELMSRPEHPSLKEGLPLGRRSLTITTDLQVTSRSRREQQLPSWMTQDFAGETSEGESHEHEKVVGEGHDHPEDESDVDDEHGSEEVNAGANNTPDDHNDGHVEKMDKPPHSKINATKQDGMHSEHSDEDGGHYDTDSNQGIDDHYEAHENEEGEGNLLESHLSHDDDHSDVDNDGEAHHAPHSSDEDYTHASHDAEHHDEISLASAIQAATTLTGSFIKSVVPAHSSDDQKHADLVDSHEDESHDDDHHSDHSEEDGEVHLSDDLAAHPSHDDGLAKDDHSSHDSGFIEEIHPSHNDELGMDDVVIGEVDEHSDDGQDDIEHNDEHNDEHGAHNTTAYPEDDEVEHTVDIDESEMADADGEDDHSEDHLHSQEDPVTEEDSDHDTTAHIGGGQYDADGSFAGRKWSSELVPDFIAGHTSTLPRCPHGLTIHVDGPDEMERGEVLRTGQTYKFRLRGEIWVDDIRKEYGLDSSSHLYSSDGGKAKVAVQILFCPIGKHCTPFIYDGHAEDGAEGGHDSHDHRYLQGEPHDHSEDEKHHDDETVTGTSSHASHDSHEDGTGEHALHIVFSHDSHDDGGRIQHQHIQSETLLLEFDDPDQDIFLIDFEKEVTVDFPGEFVPLGHIQFFVTDGTNGASASLENVVFKIDSANTLHQGVVRFQAPPTIKKVGRGSEIFSYLMIFLVGLLELFLLVSTVRNRNHSVIRLSQGIFLVVCLFSSLVASTSSFLFNPKSDIYCLTYGPVVMIPLQVMLAVIIGRLHRIIAVMMPLMAWQQSQYNNRGRKKSKRAKKIGKMLPSWTGDDTRGSRRTSQSSASSSSLSSDSSDSESGGNGIAQRARRFRKKKFQHRTLKVEFSEKKLWAYVALISSPQIIVQIIGLALYPQSIVVLLQTSLLVDNSVTILMHQIITSPSMPCCFSLYCIC